MCDVPKKYHERTRNNEAVAQKKSNTLSKVNRLLRALEQHIVKLLNSLGHIFLLVVA